MPSLEATVTISRLVDPFNTKWNVFVADGRKPSRCTTTINRRRLNLAMKVSGTTWALKMKGTATSDWRSLVQIFLNKVLHPFTTCLIRNWSRKFCSFVVKSPSASKIFELIGTNWNPQDVLRAFVVRCYRTPFEELWFLFFYFHKTHFCNMLKACFQPRSVCKDPPGALSFIASQLNPIKLSWTYLCSDTSWIIAYWWSSLVWRFQNWTWMT